MAQATNGGEQNGGAQAPEQIRSWQIFKRMGSWKAGRAARREQLLQGKIHRMGIDYDVVNRFVSYFVNQLRTDKNLQQILKRTDFLDIIKNAGVENESNYHTDIKKSEYATALERQNTVYAEEKRGLREDIVYKLRNGAFEDLFEKDFKGSRDILDIIIMAFSRRYPGEFFKYMMKGVESATVNNAEVTDVGAELGALGVSLVNKKTFREEEPTGMGGDGLITLELSKKVKIMGEMAREYVEQYIEEEFNRLGGLVTEEEKMTALSKCNAALMADNPAVPHKDDSKNESTKELVKLVAKIGTLKEKKGGIKTDHKDKLTSARGAKRAIERSDQDKKEEEEKWESDVKETIDEIKTKFTGEAEYETKLRGLLLGMIEDVKNDKEAEYDEKKSDIDNYERPIKMAFENALERSKKDIFTRERCEKATEKQNIEFFKMLQLSEQMDEALTAVSEYRKIEEKVDSVIKYYEKYAYHLPRIVNKDVKKQLEEFKMAIPGDESLDVNALVSKVNSDEQKKYVKNAAACLVWVNKLLKEVRDSDVGIEDVKDAFSDRNARLGETINVLERIAATVKDYKSNYEQNLKEYQKIRNEMELTVDEEDLLIRALNEKDIRILFDDNHPESKKFIELLNGEDVEVLFRAFEIEEGDVTVADPKKRKKKMNEIQKEIKEVYSEYMSKRGYKYRYVNVLEYDLREIIEKEESLSEDKKERMLLALKVICANEKKRLDIRIASETAPLLDDPPFLHINDYLIAENRYLGGIMEPNTLEDDPERKSWWARAITAEWLKKSGSYIASAAGGVKNDIRYFHHSTPHFPTFRRMGRFVTYTSLGALIAFNGWYAITGKIPFTGKQSLKLNPDGNVAVEIGKSLLNNSAYPGKKVRGLFLKMSDREREIEDYQRITEPTRVVWDGEDFYFEIDGEKKSLGESMTLYERKDGKLDIKEDPYGYYKSAYFKNSETEPDDSILKWLSKRPGVVKFFEEMGMNNQWVHEIVVKKEGIAEGMEESGWEKVEPDDNGNVRVKGKIYKLKEGEVALEKWLLRRYEGDAVLNTEKTAEFIEDLQEREGDTNITYNTLKKLKTEFQALDFLVTREIGGFMNTHGLTTDEAKWILKDELSGKQARQLLAELEEGKTIGEKEYTIDERYIGQAIKELYSLEGNNTYFAELSGMNEDNVMKYLDKKGYIGDPTHKPLVNRFGLTFANARWISQRTDVLELLYHLKAEREIDGQRYSINDVNKFIDNLKSDNTINIGGDLIENIAFGLPGYAGEGYLKEISGMEYLGIQQEQNWQWLQEHGDIMALFKKLRIGMEYTETEKIGTYYYLSPGNLMGDRFVEALKEAENIKNKHGQGKVNKLTKNEVLDKIGDYWRMELVLKKYPDKPSENSPPIPGVKSNLGWMMHFGVQEAHASDITESPEIRDAFSEIYQSDAILNTFRGEYKGVPEQKVSAVRAINKQRIFHAVAEEISKNQYGSGITCDGLTGQCKFKEDKQGEESAKDRLKSITIRKIKDMKKDKMLNENIPEEEKEPEVEVPETAESAEAEAGKEPVTVSPPDAPTEGETEEEEKPAKKKKKGKKGKKAGKKPSGGF